jgi:hypothetical protein
MEGIVGNTVVTGPNKGSVAKSLVMTATFVAAEELNDKRTFYECEGEGQRLSHPDRYGDAFEFIKLPNENAAEFDEGVHDWRTCFDPILRSIRLGTACSVDFGSGALAKFLAAARNTRIAEKTNGGATFGAAILVTAAPDVLESAFEAAADVRKTFPNAKLFWVENALAGKFGDLHRAKYQDKVDELNAEVLRLRHLPCPAWKFVQTRRMDELAELTAKRLTEWVDEEEAERSSLEIRKFVLHLIQNVGMPIAKWAMGQ